MSRLGGEIFSENTDAENATRFEILRNKHFDTLALAADSTIINIDDVIHLKARSVGGGGQSTWDAIAVGTTANVDLPNTFSIIILTEDPTIVLVLRDDEAVGINALARGAGDPNRAFARTAVQYVFDNAPTGSVLYFPKFLYVFEPPGVGVPYFKIKRNVSVLGESPRAATLRFDGADAVSDMFEVSIEENGSGLGQGNVISWFFRNITAFFNGEGRHCLHKTTGGFVLGLANSKLTDCTLTANFNNGGRSFIADGGWTYSVIEGCELRPGVSLLGVADGNKIINNTINGKGWGVILDINKGAYRTKVLGGTIVNRDGAVWVINGEQVTIEDVQMEQDADEGVNQDPISAHIFIEGRDYRGSDCRILNNNLGGGTNVNNLIYIDRANNTIIAENFANAAKDTGFDVVFTALARFNKIMKTNTWKGNGNNPRTTDRINVVCSDSGRGNYGCLQDLSTLTTFNGWVGAGNYYKDPEMGKVVILGSFNSGTVSSNTAVADFPDGFFADVLSNNAATDSLGLFMGFANTIGRLSTVTVPNSNASLFKNFEFNAQGDEEI